MEITIEIREGEKTKKQQQQKTNGNSNKYMIRGKNKQTNKKQGKRHAKKHFLQCLQKSFYFFNNFQFSRFLFSYHLVQYPGFYL